MVAIAQATPRNQNEEIDRDAWFNLLSIRYPKEKLKSFSQWFGLSSVRGLEVANILLELHADLDAILAALLIDHPHDELQHEHFPKEICLLLKNVEALGQVDKTILQQKRSNKIEEVRQMMLAMIKDVRVVLIKLAERTYAARTLKNLPAAERGKLAYAIMELYAPLANRLGIGALKWELEDRAFAILEPKPYQEITAVLKVRRAEREAFIQNFLEDLELTLSAASIKAEISGRVKHIYSIWRKMQKKHLSFEDLYDVRAVRILVRDVASCYATMALLHAKWTPLVSEYTDYIVQPKANGYRSLHTVLVGEDQLPIEVQIRTFGMHEQAESGVAAHWRYKEGGGHATAAQDRVNWLRTLLDWQTEVNTGAALPSRPNETIYVFTKDNEVFALSAGATPVDFAFLIHTNIGLRTKGALVNGKMVPLTHVLATGDQVEILTHKAPNPSHDWLTPAQGYLKTMHAKRKLRAYFRSLAATDAKEIIVPIDAPVSAPKRLRTAVAKPQGISLSGLENLPFERARCCNPPEGSLIMASITRARGMVIHRQDCKNIAYFQTKRPERLFKVKWIND